MTHIVALDEPGKRVVLTGNEAIARGAIEAGVQVATGYPGTPSSEILETLAAVAKELGFHAEWSVNEKVAFDVAAGAAIVGARAIVTMKNAGVNWVMDMFATLPYTGVRGGFVLVAADDPDAFYSSTEQDTRPLGKAVGVLVLEPLDQNEAKEMAKEAFDYSEKFELPVMLRSVTRVSHSSGDVTFGPIRKERNPIAFDRHWKLPFRWNVYGPTPYGGKVGPAARHAWLIERFEKIRSFVNEVKFNWIEKGNSDLGIIASGIGYAYVKDSLIKLEPKERPWILKIGTPNPIPLKLLKELLKHVNKVLVVEEGDPLVEEQVLMYMKEEAPDVKVLGKSLNKVFRPYGELGIDQVVNVVAKFLGIEPLRIPKERKRLKEEIAPLVAPRSSSLCPGCQHLGTYWALRWALLKITSKFKGKMKGVWIINGDIGCYEQGGYGIFAKEIKPSISRESVRYEINNPYEILDTNYIMGGGIGLAQGQFHAGYRDGPIVAVAGDSTFFHACMPALLNATFNKAGITFIVLDNAWTAMTGHQPSPSGGITAVGEKSKVYPIEEVAKALGVEHVRVVDPYNLKETEEAIMKALETTLSRGVTTLVVARRECALQVLRRKRKAGEPIPKYVVDESKCVGCRLCVQLGCPAIGFDEGKKKAWIDQILCVGCSMCAQICPAKAIKLSEG